MIHDTIHNIFQRPENSSPITESSLQVRKHAAKLPANVKLPQSVALPFGTCEKVMADAANAELATQIKDLEKTLKGSQVILRPRPQTVLLDLSAFLQTRIPFSLISDPKPFDEVGAPMLDVTAIPCLYFLIHRPVMCLRARLELDVPDPHPLSSKSG